MKNIALAEFEYGKAMQRAVKPFKEELAKLKEKADKYPKSHHSAILDNTVTLAWTRLLDGVEMVSNTHIDISESFNAERKNIKLQSKEIETYFADKFKGIRAQEKILQDKISILEKASAVYEKDIREVDIASGTLKKHAKDPSLTREKIDKTKNEYEKKAVAASNSNSSYRAALVDLNKFKNTFYTEILVQELDTIQSFDEERRIASSKQYLIKILDLVTAPIPKNLELWKALTAIASQIDSQKDSNILIDKLQTGDLLPLDFTISDTAEDHKTKLLLKSAIVDVNRQDPTAEQAIMSLDSKKGRKLAVDRIKTLEKEMADVLRQKELIDNICVIVGESVIPCN